MFPLRELKYLKLYDMHIHIGPEIIPRRYDAVRLAEELAGHDMGAVVKNHFVPTSYLAQSAGLPENLTCSVTMNTFVGGIYPDALRSLLGGVRRRTDQKEPDKRQAVVWMPTISSAAHLGYYGRDLDPAWGVDPRFSQPREDARALSVIAEDGLLRPDVDEVLRQIAAHDLVLATGHLSREEVFCLVDRALELGCRRIVVTHPFFPPTDLSVQDQKSLSERPGVYIEHCWFVSVVDGVPLERYAESIGVVGARKTVLSSDSGQVVGDPLPVVWCRFIDGLLSAGINLDDIVRMAGENPRRLLFGDPQ